jgi:hypothetical protein
VLCIPLPARAPQFRVAIPVRIKARVARRQAAATKAEKAVLALKAAAAAAAELSDSDADAEAPAAGGAGRAKAGAGAAAGKGRGKAKSKPAAAATPGSRLAAANANLAVLRDTVADVAESFSDQAGRLGGILSGTEDTLAVVSSRAGNAAYRVHGDASCCRRPYHCLACLLSFCSG